LFGSGWIDFLAAVLKFPRRLDIRSAARIDAVMYRQKKEAYKVSEIASPTCGKISCATLSIGQEIAAGCLIRALRNQSMSPPRPAKIGRTRVEQSR